MLEEFQSFILKHSLIANNERIMLTVSGGIDSMVMLHLFIKSGYEIAVAHCNFGLRGAESNGDEQLVKETCAKNNIPFYNIQFETLKYANEHKISIQMAARTLRYNWFEQLSATHNYDLIATAHHQNDVAETMLINITRGTGISGLHGIFEKKKNIIRPLLFATKAQIENYAAAQQIEFREDSSNKKLDYWRNRIRLAVIPELATLNENVVNSFFELSNKIRIDELLLQEKVNDLKKTYTKTKNNLVYIDLSITKHFAAKTLLYHILKQYDFNETDILQLTDNQFIAIGGILESKTHQLLVDRKYLIIKERSLEVISQTIEINKTTLLIETPIGKINFETLSLPPTQFLKNCLYLDKEKTGTSFTLQTWQQGDRFKPLGMKGSKLVSDFLIDKKINQFEKEKCLVLTSKNNNEIAALIPYQISNDFKITEDTKSILKITFCS